MKVAGNVIEVLKLLIRSDGEISVADVARLLDVNRSSASRLLASLRSGGLLQQDSKSAKYRLGVLAIQLGAFAQRTFSYFDFVQSHLSEVVDATRHTACLGLLDEDDVVIAYSHRNRDNPISVSFDLGARIPAHLSSLGKILLAQKSNTELRSLLPDQLKQRNGGAPRSLDAFLQEMAGIRRDQIAASRDEIAVGITSYSVCIAAEPGMDLAVGVALVTTQGAQEEKHISEVLLDFKRRMEGRAGIAKSGR